MPDSSKTIDTSEAIVADPAGIVRSIEVGHEVDKREEDFRFQLIQEMRQLPKVILNDLDAWEEEVYLKSRVPDVSPGRHPDQDARVLIWLHSSDLMPPEEDPYEEGGEMLIGVSGLICQDGETRSVGFTSLDSVTTTDLMACLSDVDLLDLAQLRVALRPERVRRIGESYFYDLQQQAMYGYTEFD